jgi:carbon-monoxide dehydrogenase medium subunit
MKPAPFVYHAPRTVEEALALLASEEDARVLAGGQTLVPTMAFRLAKPGHLIDINGIAELDYLRIEDGRLRIGALTRHAAFHAPVVAGPLGRMLTEVVKHIAHYTIRTRGTFCGSLAYADPASEWCLVAATLDADIVLRGSDGERIVAARDFFVDLLTTDRDERELIVAVSLPILPENVRFGFAEFNRRSGDYGLAMALVTLELENDLICAARIGIGGAEARPRRISEAEKLLDRQTAGPAVFRAAAEAASAAIEPLVDVQADADFRRELARTMVLRALERSVQG